MSQNFWPVSWPTNYPSYTPVDSNSTEFLCHCSLPFYQLIWSTKISTSEAEIRHACHLFARLCAWMPVRTWFLCPAIVSIDYTGSQRMVQVKATMCRIWEFLTVGRPVEASQDTPAVCLCFQSNLKYAKACSNSTLKWLQSHADLWEMYSVRTSVTDGNKSGHFEYFMLLLAVKVHWNEEKRMAIGSYETEYEIMYFRKFSDSY